MKYLKLFLAYFLLAHYVSVSGAKLTVFDVNEVGEQARIKITLDGLSRYKVFTLTNPDRVVVDLYRTALAVDLLKIKLKKNLIENIRGGAPSPGDLRLVLEVKKTVSIKTEPFKKNSFFLTLLPSKISMSDIVNKQQISGKSKLEQISETEKVEPAPLLAVKSLLSLEKKRAVIIALDAGHGGTDPGAKGSAHLEKNITLAIALKLKQLIDKQPGMKAILTRQGDYYIDLRERLKIARKNKADVFVSVHADAFIHRHSHGASVFALSQAGATSEAARWLAEKENNSELGGVNLSSLDDKNGLIRTVLIDLSQTATINASLHMGERVLRHLAVIATLHNNKVDQARFMVLKSPDIPSILIETGFITNPKEERNLSNTFYQNRLSQAVFLGLRQFFLDYPPPGTLMEALANAKGLHIVKKGERLSTIAKKNRIALAELKAVNHLSGDGVTAGQPLIIPHTKL